MTRTWRDYNYFLIGCVIVLTGFSLAIIYSITFNNTDIQGYFSRHLVNIIIGMVAAALITTLDYHALQAWARPLYLLSIGGLVFILVAGYVSGGAQSWFKLGERLIQPSEPSKLLIIIALAAYWAHFGDKAGAWNVQAGALILAGIPIGLVFIQPDFGTAMVFVTIWAAMAWTAGMRWWQILMLAAIAIPVAVYGWNNVLELEQRNRLLVFIDPQKFDPTGQFDSWDVSRALEAIAGGGLTGMGWKEGLVTQGGYVYALYTDFIFASAAEELGFIGAAVLILFECILMWQALVIAGIARDMFGRLIAVGITAMIFCHVLINIGMSMQIMPVTGIPLPFVSYGGSFTLTTLAAIGLLESIALHRRRIVFG
jgi:rod shape determining protein RodA